MRRYVKAAVVLALVPLAAFGPADRNSGVGVVERAPARWALIVGINDYINFTDEPGGDLRGAVRDAQATRDVLVYRWGFPPENIHLLLDGAATRDAIRAQLTEWLPSVVQSGDQVLFFFAGHGSQVWDENGDEDDGLDETIAPADVRADSPEYDIVDEQLGEWLRQIPTSNVVFIHDNCHAGTGTRAATPFARLRLLHRDVNRLPQPPGVSRRALPDQIDRVGFNTGSETVLELAATRPEQAAVDAQFPGPEGSEPYYGGAFTTFFVRQLWMAPASATYESVFESTKQALERARFDQMPTMNEHPLRSAPLFHLEGSASAAARPFIPATLAGNNTVELAGGDALGITEGSVFQLENGAQAIVESVSATSARARIVSGAPGSVGPDGALKARLVAYRFSEEPLRVNIAGLDTQTRGALTQRIRSAPGLTLVDGADEFAHLLVRRSADAVRVLGLDGATRHTFSLGPDLATQLAAALGQEAAAKRLAEMENLVQPFQVEASLSGGKTSFGIGESVTFRARSEHDGYLTLVDLGTDGTVTVLFPNPWDKDNRIRAGQALVFPSESMESEVQAMPPTGRGIVRALVTSRPLDIPLTQGELTSGDALLADRIAQALKDAAGRSEVAPDAVRLDTWAGASVVYRIEK